MKPMNKRLKRLVAWTKPPRLTVGNPQLRGSFASIDGSAEREAREHNQAEIAQANYEVTKEALQKNLSVAYGALVTSILASVIATLALIVTILKK